MSHANWKPCHLFLPVLVALLVLASGAMAQQPISPSPDSSVPATSGSETAKSQDKRQAQPRDQSDNQGNPAQTPRTGKSKLEQDTGTINDRIFEVMPNYGTVENADILPALTTKQKYRLATAGVFDYVTFPFIGALAAIGQANNNPSQWGQGWDAYGKRYGSSFADNGIGTYMTTAIYPSILHEDPRYYQMGKGSFSRRSYHALSRLFIARTDSGHTRFNYSEILGNATATGISNIYHPSDDRTVSQNMTTLGMLMMWDGVSNVMKEFWPDIRRKLFHKKAD